MDGFMGRKRIRACPERQHICALGRATRRAGAVIIWFRCMTSVAVVRLMTYARSGWVLDFTEAAK